MTTSTDAIRRAEIVATDLTNTPSAPNPPPTAPRRAYPGRDAALAEGRDPLRPKGA